MIRGEGDGIREEDKMITAEKAGEINWAAKQFCG